MCFNDTVNSKLWKLISPMEACTCAILHEVPVRVPVRVLACPRMQLQEGRDGQLRARGVGKCRINTQIQNGPLAAATATSSSHNDQTTEARAPPCCHRT